MNAVLICALVAVGIAIGFVIRELIQAERLYKRLSGELESMKRGEALFYAPRRNMEIR